MVSIDLALLPYHVAIRDFLKREEARVWEWFDSHKVRDEQADAVRFDLLKKTYRIERAADPRLYEMADEVMSALALSVPLTIYQAQNPEGLNAALAYVPNELHIVFAGPIQTRLNESEIRALLAHEMTHYSLWQGWQGELLIADQILAALTHDAQASPAHFASARLFQLYNEIFCDRGALAVVGDPLVVVSTLVKLETGLDAINAESYIRQAEEVFSRGSTKTAGVTHPEAFIRARAVRLWHERDEHANDTISEMIEGALALDELDLLGQQKLSLLTRRLIDTLLAPKWLQTDLVQAHAKLFFPEFAPPPTNHQDVCLPDDLRTEDKQLGDYYCYVLLDFATCDRELEEAPLAAALQLTETLGLKERLMEIARKELRLTKKQLDRIDREKVAVVAAAAKAMVQA